jgi:hypothetical protein
MYVCHKHRHFSSRFTGSDIDIESLGWAKKNVELNSDYSTYIKLLHTDDSSAFQRALLDYIHSESSILEIKGSKRQKNPEADSSGILDVVEDHYGNESGDEVVEGNNDTPLLLDLRNQLPITRFLISQYCRLIGDGNPVAAAAPPNPPSPTSARVHSSPSPSLLPCFTGPVRCAITASGIQDSKAATRLERAFMRNNAHLLKPFQTSIEQRSAKSDDRFSTISSGEAEHDTANDKNENQNENHKANGSPDEDVNERLFYTACMTNPPFYDEDEKVRRFPLFYFSAAFLYLLISIFFTAVQYSTSLTITPLTAYPCCTDCHFPSRCVHREQRGDAYFRRGGRVHSRHHR